MINRRQALTFLLGSSAAAISLSFTNQASAERRYNSTERRWEEYDPNVIRTDRKLPSKFKRRNVSINTSYKPGTILISTDEKFLYYITGKNKAIRYGVGVGREGFTWNGKATIQRKQEWPSWTPPAEMRAREAKKGRKLPITQKGGIKNPLGARAMYLYKGGRDSMYRIHGTNQPWSIGLNLSSGCIRMMNKDVEHLYDRAKIGTQVVVLGPGESAASKFNERKGFMSMFNFKFKR